MAGIKSKMKDKMNKAENKAYETKGRIEQKTKDMRRDKTDRV